MDALYFTGAVIALALFVWGIAQLRGAEWHHFGLNFFDGLNRLYCRYYHGLTRQQIDLPVSGAAIVVANHISGLDPVMLQALSPRPLRFMVAREEYQRPLIHRLMRAARCIPVDRDENPRRAFREAVQALQQGEVLAIFPHGGIRHPVQQDTRLKGGAVRLAQKHDIPVYPVIFSNVLGAGFTLLALVLPSRVRVRFAEPFRCYGIDYDECMKVMADLLNVKGQDNAT